MYELKTIRRAPAVTTYCALSWNLIHTASWICASKKATEIALHNDTKKHALWTFRSNNTVLPVQTGKCRISVHARYAILGPYMTTESVSSLMVLQSHRQLPSGVTGIECKIAFVSP